MATHSSILPGESPRTEEPHGLQTIGSQRVACDLTHAFQVWKHHSLVNWLLKFSQYAYQIFLDIYIVTTSRNIWWESLGSQHIMPWCASGYTASISTVLCHFSGKYSQHWVGQKVPLVFINIIQKISNELFGQPHVLCLLTEVASTCGYPKKAFATSSSSVRTGILWLLVKRSS